MTHWDPSRNPLGRFVPGSGGRPRGARNRAGRELRRAFEQSMQDVTHTIDEVRRKDPSGYLRMLMRAIPTPAEDEFDPAEQLTPEEMEVRLRELCVDLIAEGYGPEDSPPAGEADAGKSEQH